MKFTVKKIARIKILFFPFLPSRTWRDKNQDDVHIRGKDSEWWLDMRIKNNDELRIINAWLPVCSSGFLGCWDHVKSVIRAYMFTMSESNHAFEKKLVVRTHDVAFWLQFSRIPAPALPRRIISGIAFQRWCESSSGETQLTLARLKEIDWSHRSASWKMTYLKIYKN
jgi:hypothetical protein